ncbi:MAG: hypothetical protein MHMPM18_004533, partial [Marteilia pararefringens]
TNCKLSRRFPTCQLRPDLRRQVDNQCLYKQHYLPYPPPPPNPLLMNNATNHRSWDEIRPKYHPSYDFLANSRANLKSRPIEPRCNHDEDLYDDHYIEMNRKGGGKKVDKQEALGAANPAIVPSFNRCKSGTTLMKNETPVNGMIIRSSNCSTGGDKRHSWKLQPNFVTRAFLNKNVAMNERHMVENNYGDSKKFTHVDSFSSSSKIGNQRNYTDNLKCDSDPKLGKYEHELERSPKTSPDLENVDNKNKTDREKGIEKTRQTPIALDSRSTCTDTKIDEDTNCKNNLSNSTSST